jgi:hypothetical protein
MKRKNIKKMIKKTEKYHQKKLYTIATPQIIYTDPELFRKNCTQ